MFAVQISKNRKAYQTITGPTGFDGAHDNYLTVLKFRAEKGVKVRFVRIGRSAKDFVKGTRVTVTVLRKAVAEGKHMASLWVPAGVQAVSMGGSTPKVVTLPTQKSTKKAIRRTQDLKGSSINPLPF